MTTVERLMSPRLIGRGDELARLAAAAERAIAGEGQCVLVAGEAGIGKTRLLAELRAGFRGITFVGQCYEEERSVPLAPLAFGLRTLLARRAAEIPAFVGTHGGAAGSGDPGGEPAAVQRALFEAIADSLFDIAGRDPLLLLFEDLHWSDESTLAFIRFFSRRLAGRRVLLAGAYRPGEAVTDNPALAGLLATLQREHLAETITLAPLRRNEVDALVRDLLDPPAGRPVEADLLDAVADVSEGNPFYIEELIRAMIQAGDLVPVDGGWARPAARRAAELRVPTSVLDAVQRRTAGLSASARRVLGVAAVAGREFDFGVLLAVTGLPEVELVASLKTLIAAGFIAEAADDAFAFRHTLLREAAQAQLLARERRAIHLQVAGALERLHGGEGHAAELAYHTYEAWAWEPALAYARAAAEQARRLDATREALHHLDRALESAHHLDLAPPLDLLLASAELHERLGDFEAADADLRAAHDEAVRAGQVAAAWQAQLRLGNLWASRDYGRSLAFFQAALALAETLGEPASTAETLNRIGNVYLNRDQPGRALPYHRAALAAFEATGDLTAQADTLELLSQCYYNLPDVLAAAECEERALALGRAEAATTEAAAAGDDAGGAAVAAAAEVAAAGDDAGGAAVAAAAEVAAAGDDAGSAAVAAADVVARAAGARSVVFHASIHLLLPLGLETEVGPPVDAARLVRLGEEALATARAMGWLGGESQALGLLGGFFGRLGAYDRSLACLHEALEVARRMGHAAGVAAGERMLGEVLLELLAYDEAAGRLRRALETANGAGAQLFADIAALDLSRVLAARRAPGDLAEADALLRDLAARVRDGPGSASGGGLGASSPVTGHAGASSPGTGHAGAGRPDTGRAGAGIPGTGRAGASSSSTAAGSPSAGGLDASSPGAGAGGAGATNGRIVREVQAVRAELALSQGEPAAALALLEPLIRETRHLDEGGLAAVPRLALLLGRALRAAKRYGEAADALDAALAGAARLGRRPLAWRGHAALGRLCLDMGRRTAAREHFAQARAEIAAEAARVPGAALRETFTRAALATIPAPRPPTERRRATAAHHGLTERERAVARLVAEGQSNRAIGEALVISERTAERHVANILAKLGLGSRAALAAWVAGKPPDDRASAT